MSTPLIGVSDDFFDILREHAGRRGVALNLARIGRDGKPLDDVSGIQAVMSTGMKQPHLRQLLRDHDTIRWVAAQSAGVDGVLVPEVMERSVTVTRVRHVHDIYVAEFAMGQILAACKRIPELVLAQQRKEWITLQPPVVAGRTLAMIGYGEIGQALARRARAFDMRVIGVRARPRPDEYADEVWGADRTDDALRQADYVVLAVPGGGDRQHLIDERRLRLLKKEAFLINVGRGEVVDEAALDRVLREDGFAGALIDTFAVEPLPQNSPLWTNPRVLVSPHLAGLRGAPTGDNVLDQLVDNMDRFARGEPLHNEVDIQKGY